MRKILLPLACSLTLLAACKGSLDPMQIILPDGTQQELRIYYGQENVEDIFTLADNHYPLEYHMSEDDLITTLKVRGAGEMTIECTELKEEICQKMLVTTSSFAPLPAGTQIIPSAIE